MAASLDSQNRLREHFQHHLARNPPKRLQSDIVRDLRDEIIGLIKDDGAGLTDVVNAVAAEGEAVLAPGFKAQVLAQIGTVKMIRAGLAKPASGKPPAAPAPSTSSQADVESAAITAERPADDLDDDDDLFAARSPRG